MSADGTLGSAILGLLASHGVDVAFGLPGVHNLAFWSAESAVRIVGVRHEQAAVYAADGYARATGRLGVAITTSGPGAANGVAAFGEAASCGSPILVIASEVSTALRHPDGPRGILHEMADQAALFTPFGVRAVTASTAEEALTEIASALAAAETTPTSPRYVGIPSDVLNGPVPPMPTVAPSAAPRSATESEVAALAGIVMDSPRVVIWAGGGIVQCGAEGERALSALAETLGAPVVTTYAARGVMAGHPLIVEAPPHEPEVADVIAAADLILVVGSAFDAMNTRNWKMPMPPRSAAIGLGPELPRTIAWDVLVDADLVTTIDALIPLLGKPRDPWSSSDLRAAVRHRLDQDPRTSGPMDFVRAIETWPADGVIVCDMAVSGYWTGGYAVQPRPRRLQYPVGWGTLGYALPAAMGPAAAGIPTLAVCGDGGPMFAIGELATLAQERLPVTLVVVDDGGYGMLRFDQQVFGHPERGVDLLTPDWVALAGAFGIACTVVDDSDALAGALADSIAADSIAADSITAGAGVPRVIVLRRRFYPPRTTSPRWFEELTGPRETA